MLTLSGAPDLVVSWSDFLVFSLYAEVSRICRQFFKLLQDLSFYLNDGPMWMLVPCGC